MGETLGEFRYARGQRPFWNSPAASSALSRRPKTLTPVTQPLTWNDAAGEYHGVWFDNVSTGGPVTTKGDWEDQTPVVEFTTESRRRDGSVIRHKIVERFVDEKTRVATTYLIDGVDVIKRLEVEYVRTVPCPTRFRRILDDIDPRRRR